MLVNIIKMDARIVSVVFIKKYQASLQLAENVEKIKQHSKLVQIHLKIAMVNILFFFFQKMICYLYFYFLLIFLENPFSFWII